MYKVLLLGCVAVLTLETAPYAAADEPNSPKWEYKAVSFHDIGTNAATKLLNDLGDEGWEYVGPLASDMVAFRRVAANGADAAIKKERERLQGTWTTISTELDGQQRTEDKKAEKLTITGTKWSLKLDGQVSQEGTYKIVEIGVKFHKVDFIVTEGFKQGDTWSSIIFIDGDKMKWIGCYTSENKVRPKIITTREGDGYFLRTLKREK